MRDPTPLQPLPEGIRIHPALGEPVPPPARDGNASRRPARGAREPADSAMRLRMD